MKNTQRIWILYAIVLCLNCLAAEEGARTAKRLLIVNTARLIQPIYFEDALSSKFKPKDLLPWRSFAFDFTRNKKLWINYWLRNKALIEEDTLKNLEW